MLDSLAPVAQDRKKVTFTGKIENGVLTLSVPVTALETGIVTLPVTDGRKTATTGFGPEFEPIALPNGKSLRLTAKWFSARLGA